MMFRLQTMMGTFYSTSAREIVHLEGLFMGAGHNVSYETNTGVSIETDAPSFDRWEIRGGVS